MINNYLLFLGPARPLRQTSLIAPPQKCTLSLSHQTPSPSYQPVTEPCVATPIASMSLSKVKFDARNQHPRQLMTHPIAKLCNPRFRLAVPQHPQRALLESSQGKSPTSCRAKLCKLRSCFQSASLGNATNFLLERDFLGVEQVHPQPQVEEPRK